VRNPSRRAGRLLVAGLLGVVVLGACEARHARTDDPGEDIRVGEGVQGSVDDARCKDAPYVLRCSQAAAIDDMLGAEASHYQVEQRRIEVDATNVVHLACHYLVRDKLPGSAVSAYSDRFDLAGSPFAVSGSGRTMRLTGRGDYRGWAVTLTFAWSGKDDTRQDVDVRCAGAKAA
jgi:hypothetical protein